MREYRPGDQEVWRSIQTEADWLNSITLKMFAESFGDDEEELARRQLYLCDSSGTPIGTSTAWHSVREDCLWGRVHWVAIRPDWQGRGLAKPLLSETLQRLEDLGHDKVFLTTATPRYPAITLYLNFGFAPEIRNDDDRSAWEQVAEKVDHPLLDQALKIM